MEASEWGGLVLPLAAVALAFCISAIATPLVRYLARRYGFVAQPRPDRWHQRPTALLGGVAIYLGIAVPLVLLSPSGGGLRLLALGVTGIFVLGLVDDLVKLRPQQKLVGQIALASLVAAGGIVFRGVPVALLAVPMTVFWVVAITNAFNLLDNMDGLTAGVACVTGTVLAVLGLVAGNMGVAIAAACIVGASAGFLLYNSYPASIFMGDAGSLALGFAVSELAVLGNGYGASQNVLLTAVVPIAVLGVPLFDTALVSVMRTLAGRPISQGGRDHTSHRLVALGLSESQTVRVLYVITALFGGFALATRFMDVLASITVLALLLVGLALFGRYLAQVRVYHDKAAADAPVLPRGLTARGAAVAQKVPWGEVLLDSVLIVVAYLGSYLLKFESNIYGPFLTEFARSLPYVIALKLGVFLLAGAYQGAWRYTGLEDVVSLGKASTLASLACVAAVAVIWRFDDFSRSVFVIDWLLFTWLVVLSRMSFRLLSHWVQTLSGAQSSGVLVVGRLASASGVIRAVQQGVFGDCTPVGFVDMEGNGKGTANRRIAGVSVFRGARPLGEILDDLNAGGISVEGVLAVSKGESAATRELEAECSRRALRFMPIHPLVFDSDDVVDPGVVQGNST